MLYLRCMKCASCLSLPSGECFRPSGECIRPSGECFRPSGECFRPHETLTPFLAAVVFLAPRIVFLGSAIAEASVGDMLKTWSTFGPSFGSMSMKT